MGERIWYPVMTYGILWRFPEGLVCHMKNDQSGDRPRDPLYANTLQPAICLILALAIYWATTTFDEVNRLFLGSDQSRGANPFDLGTHLMRKSAVAFFATCTTVCPSSTVVHLRAGWSHGGVKIFISDMKQQVICMWEERLQVFRLEYQSFERVLEISVSHHWYTIYHTYKLTSGLSIPFSKQRYFKMKVHSKYRTELGHELTVLWPLLCDAFSRRIEWTGAAMTESGRAGNITEASIRSDGDEDKELLIPSTRTHQMKLVLKPKNKPMRKTIARVNENNRSTERVLSVRRQAAPDNPDVTQLFSKLTASIEAANATQQATAEELLQSISGLHQITQKPTLK
ncbi:LOW QUALITY PROTEIN: hypothetical protein PHMEG_00014407 [Phytophthora megakarya]|uniref:Uncharacterized protein n=1 Tax=Phytophthora megakarya TaxID=4795 RepID=A0A225W5F9_9STRA|nr:LOW QUALITY PROTEIN: hypothetical protein PHMEG_00014407 [Phytophthora megakarya]